MIVEEQFTPANARKTGYFVIMGNPPNSAGQASANDKQRQRQLPQSWNERISAVPMATAVGRNKKTFIRSFTFELFRWASEPHW